MVDVYAYHINGILSSKEYSELIKLITPNKRNIISRLHRWEDTQRTLLGDVVARYAISKRLAVSNNDLVFNKNDYGKPLLIAPNGIHFNISHSGNWIVCAIDENPVGVDVEAIKDVDFDIAQRFFAAEEYEALMAIPENNRLRYFYRLWTLKESYVKAVGKGLSIPLNTFIIKFENNCIKFLSELDDTNWNFKQYLIDEHNVLSICALNESFSNTINLINFENLMNLLI